jgi:hypothetical protein
MLKSRTGSNNLKSWTRSVKVTRCIFCVVEIWCLYAVNRNTWSWRLVVTGSHLFVFFWHLCHTVYNTWNRHLYFNLVEIKSVMTVFPSNRDSSPHPVQSQQARESETKEAMYIQRNLEVCLHDHCCRGEVTSIAYIHTYISFTFHQSNISWSAPGYETCHNITNININDRHRQQTQTTVSQYDITPSTNNTIQYKNAKNM